LPFVRAEIGTRMTIVRLVEGGLLVHSPVKLDAQFRRSIDALGKIRAIVAPDKLHHLFIRDYIAAYPEARVYAAPGLPRKRPDLRFDDILSDTPQVRAGRAASLSRRPVTERGRVLPPRYTHADSDRSRFQSSERNSKEIASVLSILGRRTFWTASIRASPRNSRPGGGAGIRREDSAENPLSPPQRKITPARGMVSALSCELKTCTLATCSAWASGHFSAQTARRDSAARCRG
jgi:hypothetical protein